MSYRIPMLKISMVRDGSVAVESRIVNDSEKAAAMIQAVIGENDREEFIVLLLDAKNRVTGIHSVSVGTLTLSIVHPREVFKAAIMGNAAAVILAHNHPSGDTTPSREDRELTERLKQAGKLLGIAVLDHVIVGQSMSHYSFADRGEL